MKKNDVRTVNTNQEKRLVYFHLANGKTVVRTMESKEIIKAKSSHDEQQRIEEFVRLFNEKYSEPQKTEYVKLSTSDERFFFLRHMRTINTLNADEEDEYKNLLNE